MMIKMFKGLKEKHAQVLKEDLKKDSQQEYNEKIKEKLKQSKQNQLKEYQENID
jgi:hypothetical protein